MNRNRLRAKASRGLDWAARLAAAALPARVRYWATVQSMAQASAGYHGDTLSMPLDAILRRMEGGPR